MATPSVGRIVHFYTADQSKSANGVGQGPYPAIITQVFAQGTDAVMCNLKVLPPFKSPYDEGSVHTKSHAEAMGYGVRYWEWPPGTILEVSGILELPATLEPCLGHGTQVSPPASADWRSASASNG